MILAFTGHRPQKLGGFGVDVDLKLTRLVTKVLDDLKPEQVISGMALGWDQAVAFAAVRANIPVVAAIPFKGQEIVWTPDAQARYHKILAKCAEVVYVSEGGFSPAKMQTRNIWMVDHADKLIALWDGSSSGTANCVNYARRKGIQVMNVWKLWESTPS